MSLDRFVGTESSLASPGWKKPQHVLDAIKKRREAKATKTGEKNCGAGAPGSQGFQPGNTCSRGGGGSSSGSGVAALKQHQKKLASIRRRLISATEKAKAKHSLSLEQYEAAHRVINNHQSELIRLNDEHKAAMKELAASGSDADYAKVTKIGNQLLQARLALEPMEKDVAKARKAAQKDHKALRTVTARTLAKVAAKVDEEDGLSPYIRKSIVDGVVESHETDRPVESWAKQIPNGAQSVAIAARSEVKTERAAAQEFLRAVVNPTLHVKALESPIEYDEFVRENAAGSVMVPVSHAPASTVATEMVGRIQLASYSRERVIVHEYGHQLEHGTAEVAAICDEFLQHRIAGETPVKLAAVYPEARYDQDEYGAADDFRKAFAAVDTSSFPDTDGSLANQHGRSAHYAGKVYAAQNRLTSDGNSRFLGHTEVLSSGLELLHKDAAAFAKADPEWFDLVVGISTGLILDKTRQERKGS